jgi:hypothetical protein
MMGKAPEFQNISGWIASEPVTLNGLRGKVVFLDSWTYGCYNEKTGVGTTAKVCDP